MKKIIFFIIAAAVISSCVSKQYLPTSNFIPINLKELNGKYYMDRNVLYKYFNIVALDYEDKNIVYHSNHKD